MDLLSFSNVDDKQKLWAHFIYVIYVVFASLYAIFYILAKTAQLRADFLLNKGATEAGGKNSHDQRCLFNRVCPWGVEAVVIPKKVPRELAAITKKQLKVRDALESSVSTYFSKVAKHFNIGCAPMTPEGTRGIIPAEFVLSDSSTLSSSLMSDELTPIEPTQHAIEVVPAHKTESVPLADAEFIRTKFRATHRTPAVFGKKREIWLIFRQTKDGTSVGTVFVVFKDAFMAHFAAKVVATEAPVVMAERFAHVYPEDVIWQNINSDYFVRQGRGFITKVIMVAMIIFWGSLVAFVLSWTDLTSLGERIPALQTFLNDYPTISKMVGGILPPVIVAVLLSLVPPVLRILSVFGGSALTSKTETEVFSQYYGFQLCNVFAVNHNEYLGDFDSKECQFFYAISACSGFFLQLVRLILSPILGFLFGKTPRSIFKAREPPNWVYADAMAVHGLAVAIGLVYCVVAPVILVFVTLYFGLYAKESETGGRYLFTAANHLFVGLFVMEFMILSLFILSKNIPIAVMTLALVILTYWAFRQSQKFVAVIDAIPLRRLMESEGSPVVTPSEQGSWFSAALEADVKVNSWVKWLFPGLANVAEYESVGSGSGGNRVGSSQPVGGGLNPSNLEENWDELYKVFADPACGFKDTNIWIPKCGVPGIQSSVVKEICATGTEESGLIGEYRVVSFGSGVTETEKIVVEEGFWETMVEL
ncbi:hypothetical protein BDR26DRAFT_851451 [Obelidium mucronatum]|nr:hypothetical protein BDR26DRAFT_851451 [Obelidium mucronatum]